MLSHFSFEHFLFVIMLTSNPICVPRVAIAAPVLPLLAAMTEKHLG